MNDHKEKSTVNYFSSIFGGRSVGEDIDELISQLKEKSYKVVKKEQSGMWTEYDILDSNKPVAYLGFSEDNTFVRLVMQDDKEQTESIRRDFLQFCGKTWNTGEILHGENKFTCNEGMKTEMLAISKTSDYSNSSIEEDGVIDTLLNMSTVIEFYTKDGSEHIGRIELTYSNSEMSDKGNPTIVHISDDSESGWDSQYRDNRLQMVDAVEYECTNMGFSKIWASAISDSKFWEELDYDIDIDEAEKDLF